MRLCFVVFMFLLLIIYFAIILLDVVIFYLYLFCLWSFDTMWFCKDTAILQTHPVLFLNVLSLYLMLILFQIYYFHCFSQSRIWIFFYVIKSYISGQYVLFGSKSVTGDRRGCCPSLKCRGQVGTCASVLGCLFT